MMLAWVDIFNGPHVHFFQRIDAFLDSNIEAIHCTARDYYPIPVLLDLYGVEATVIGEHGGKSLYGKLIASTERMLALAQHIHEFQKKSEIGLAIHKHSVEAARVAWGLGIPSIAFLDNEIMTPQNMLVCPLARVLIAPKCIDYSVLRSFTPGHVRILQFDGVSEVANVFDHQADENVLKRLGIDTARPIAVFRSEPVLAAYNSG
ncbi:MAG: DUF354 domain-containing protein, partial [Desulfobacteraceae bacterium]|nr:DUF354 domain-containing protein [Desulfobacteraceae bacterium]